MKLATQGAAISVLKNDKGGVMLRVSPHDREFQVDAICVAMSAQNARDLAQALLRAAS